ncbi:hypothetical protein Hanom_Chr07g00611031 [Helianthus anomalus]
MPMHLSLSLYLKEFKAVVGHLKKHASGVNQITNPKTYTINNCLENWFARCTTRSDVNPMPPISLHNTVCLTPKRYTYYMHMQTSIVFLE